MAESLAYNPSSSGRWTPPEHQLFLHGIQLHGKNWKKIHQLIKTRSLSQVRSHAQKYFLKQRKRNKEGNSKICVDEQGEQSTEVKEEWEGGKESNNMSYFLTEILKVINLKGDFDFWGQLIGQQNYSNYQQQNKQEKENKTPVLKKQKMSEGLPQNEI